jgi:3-phenylpropionate/trans-cinnamate dioxygenase ferredoxin reductase subunit
MIGLHPERGFSVGRGFIGCEVAGTASELGRRVTVVEPNDHPLQGPLGALVGSKLRRRIETRGITFKLGRGVTAINECAEGVTQVLFSDGLHIEADVIVERSVRLPTPNGSTARRSI